QRECHPGDQPGQESPTPNGGRLAASTPGSAGCRSLVQCSHPRPATGPASGLRFPGSPPAWGFRQGLRPVPDDSSLIRRELREGLPTPSEGSMQSRPAAPSAPVPPELDLRADAGGEKEAPDSYRGRRRPALFFGERLVRGGPFSRPETSSSMVQVS